MKRQWKVLSAIFAFFPLIFYKRSRSALVVTGGRFLPNYLKRRIWFLLIPVWILHQFALFSFLPFFFVDPVDRQMPCAPDKDFFWEWEQCCSNPKHHLRQTYSLPLLPWERFSSSPLQEGEKKRGDRGRLTGGGREGKISGNQQDA